MITNESFCQSITRRYDTWGTFPPRHYYFFHLAANNLAFAAKNAVEFERKRIEDEEKAAQISSQKPWPSSCPEHPENWRDAAVDDDVPKWSGENGKVVDYGANLERDRFLFWKWQSDRFGWAAIIEAAFKKGYKFGNKATALPSDAEVKQARRSANRGATKYAEKIGYKLRKGKR